jgi:hypothetical protein
MRKKRTSAQIEADKLRPGRPPKLPDDKQSKRITVYLTPDEYQRFEILAQQAGVSLAELVMRPWREKEED